jgi:hypothetical protein
VKTNKANESAHHTAIPFESLPQTLKDALLITAELNMQYIWIDAICILQDGGDDMHPVLKELDS